MKFDDITPETVLPLLDQLDNNTKPVWGAMSAQRMVEHLSETFDLAMERIPVKLEISEDKIERAQQFIASEHPMPQNFKASFAGENVALRNEEMALAIDEFIQKWIEFEAFFEENDAKVTLHPNFGALNFKQWSRLNTKHIHHHLNQFGLI